MGKKKKAKKRKKIRRQDSMLMLGASLAESTRGQEIGMKMADVLVEWMHGLQKPAARAAMKFLTDRLQERMDEFQ